MNQDKKPDALRLAQHLEQFRSFPDDLAAAKELRRLHAESELHQQELASYRFTVENREARIAELEALLKFADERINKMREDQSNQLAAAQQGVQPCWLYVDCADPDYSGFYEWQDREDAYRYAATHSGTVTSLYTHPTPQGLDSKLLSLDSDLLVEARRALWRLSHDYEDGELRLRAQEYLERIDERRCVSRENIFNSHAALAAQAKQGGV